MAVEERDRYTGKLTTGHDWNGIKELDTPIPWVVLFFLAATTLFAITWTVLNPAWPTITSRWPAELSFGSTRKSSTANGPELPKIIRERPASRWP